MRFPLRSLAGLSGGLALLFTSADPATGQSFNLRDLLPDLLRQGVTLAPPGAGGGHTAHFSAPASLSGSNQFAAANALNDEIARQLSNYPLSSSAGGFSYKFDPELGVLTRPTTSFGPIYTDRPFNVGAGKFNLVMNFSRFTYDFIDESSLGGGDIQLVFLHEDTDSDGNLQPFFEGDIVTSKLYIDLDSEIFTIAATYGLRDRLDVAIAIPIVKVTLAVSSEAEVLQLSSGDTAPDTHLFTNGTRFNETRQGGTREGAGDIAFRARYLLSDTGKVRTALTGDLRLPTGDEENLLGTGAVQGKLSLLASRLFRNAAWNFNLGLSAANKGLPEAFHYSTGFDWALDPKLTLITDLIGVYVNKQPTVEVLPQTYEYNAASDGSLVPARTDLPTLAVDEDSGGGNNLAASLGFKLNFHSTFLFAANGLVPLTENGLRDGFSTLLGVEYSF